MKYPGSFVIATVLLAYFTFFLAEASFFKIHVSGILALVALGLYLSYKLKGRVIGHVEESMHVVWHFLAYVIESILFLITGGIIGAFFVGRDPDGLRITEISIDFIWKIILFQLILLVIRLLLNVISWPILNMIGKRQTNWKDILVMSYAGLRGAISLSLAIILKTTNFTEPHIDPKNDQEFKILGVLYVAFTIFWTVLLQGLTIKYMMVGIQFVKKGILFDKMKQLTKAQLNTLTVQKINKMQQEHKYRMANWDIIYSLVKVREHTQHMVKQMMIQQDDDYRSNNQKLDGIINALDKLLRKKKKDLHAI